MSLGVVEGVTRHSLRSLPCDQLNRLDDAVNNLEHRQRCFTRQKLADTDLVLNTGVLSFRVFTYENCVDIIVWRLVAGDGNTWSNVGEKVESPSEGQV